MKKLFAVIAVLFLTACTSLVVTPPSNDAEVGPVVTGKLYGQTDGAYIPFTDVVAERAAPTIATKGYVDQAAKVGTAQVLSTDTTISSLTNGDYFIMFGATKFTMPRIAVLKAAGAQDGSEFTIQAYKAGQTITIAYSGDTCYTVNSSGCPTSLAYGDAYRFKMQGNLWRATPVVRTGVAVPDVTAAPTAAQFNALLKSLRDAGLLAQ